MRSVALKAALVAILVSVPLAMASAGGRDRDRGHDGGHDKDRHHHERTEHIQGRVDRDRLAIAGSKGYTDGDATGSEALTYGKRPPVCSPYTTTWTCMPPR